MFLSKKKWKNRSSIDGGEKERRMEKTESRGRKEEEREGKERRKRRKGGEGIRAGEEKMRREE